jgi:hypothetical protein
MEPLMPSLRRSRQSITRVLLACAVLPAAAVAKPKPAPVAPALLWATINACDTVDRPNTIGIRASMPGTGLRSQRMFVRFQVQYLSGLDGKWHNVGKAADSGFIALGNAKPKFRQAGRYVTLRPADNGATYRTRGQVTFEWRDGGEVIRRVRERTETGHPGTRGADPKGFSAAECEIQ